MLARTPLLIAAKRKRKAAELGGQSISEGTSLDEALLIAAGALGKKKATEDVAVRFYFGTDTTLDVIRPAGDEKAVAKLFVKDRSASNLKIGDATRLTIALTSYTSGVAIGTVRDKKFEATSSTNLTAAPKIELDFENGILSAVTEDLNTRKRNALTTKDNNLSVKEFMERIELATDLVLSALAVQRLYVAPLNAEFAVKYGTRKTWYPEPTGFDKLRQDLTDLPDQSEITVVLDSAALSSSTLTITLLNPGSPTEGDDLSESEELNFGPLQTEWREIIESFDTNGDVDDFRAESISFFQTFLLEIKSAQVEVADKPRALLRVRDNRFEQKINRDFEVLSVEKFVREFIVVEREDESGLTVNDAAEFTLPVVEGGVVNTETQPQDVSDPTPSSQLQASLESEAIAMALDEVELQSSALLQKFEETRTLVELKENRIDVDALHELAKLYDQSEDGKNFSITVVFDEVVDRDELRSVPEDSMSEFVKSQIADLGDVALFDLSIQKDDGTVSSFKMQAMVDAVVPPDFAILTSAAGNIVANAFHEYDVPVAAFGQIYRSVAEAIAIAICAQKPEWSKRVKAMEKASEIVGQHRGNSDDIGGLVGKICSDPAISTLYTAAAETHFRKLLIRLLRANPAAVSFWKSSLAIQENTVYAVAGYMFGLEKITATFGTSETMRNVASSLDISPRTPGPHFALRTGEAFVAGGSIERGDSANEIKLSVTLPLGTNYKAGSPPEDISKFELPHGIYRDRGMFLASVELSSRSDVLFVVPFDFKSVTGARAPTKTNKYETELSSEVQSIEKIVANLDYGEVQSTLTLTVQFDDEDTADLLFAEMSEEEIEESAEQMLADLDRTKSVLPVLQEALENATSIAEEEPEQEVGVVPMATDAGAANTIVVRGQRRGKTAIDMNARSLQAASIRLIQRSRGTMSNFQAAQTNADRLALIKAYNELEIAHGQQMDYLRLLEAAIRSNSGGKQGIESLVAMTKKGYQDAVVIDIANQLVRGTRVIPTLPGEGVPFYTDFEVARQETQTSRLITRLDAIGKRISVFVKDNKNRKKALVKLGTKRDNASGAAKDKLVILYDEKKKKYERIEATLDQFRARRENIVVQIRQSLTRDSISARRSEKIDRFIGSSPEDAALVTRELRQQLLAERKNPYLQGVFNTPGLMFDFAFPFLGDDSRRSDLENALFHQPELKKALERQSRMTPQLFKRKTYIPRKFDFAFNGYVYKCVWHAVMHLTLKNNVLPYLSLFKALKTDPIDVVDNVIAKVTEFVETLEDPDSVASDPFNLFGEFDALSLSLVPDEAQTSHNEWQSASDETVKTKRDKNVETREKHSSAIRLAAMVRFSLGLMSKHGIEETNMFWYKDDERTEKAVKRRGNFELEAASVSFQKRATDKLVSKLKPLHSVEFQYDGKTQTLDKIDMRGKESPLAAVRNALVSKTGTENRFVVLSRDNGIPRILQFADAVDSISAPLKAALSIVYEPVLKHVAALREIEHIKLNRGPAPNSYYALGAQRAMFGQHPDLYAAAQFHTTLHTQLSTGMHLTFGSIASATKSVVEDGKKKTVNAATAGPGGGLLNVRSAYTDNRSDLRLYVQKTEGAADELISGVRRAASTLVGIDWSPYQMDFQLLRLDEIDATQQSPARLESIVAYLNAQNIGLPDDLNTSSISTNIIANAMVGFLYKRSEWPKEALSLDLLIARTNQNTTNEGEKVRKQKKALERDNPTFFLIVHSLAPSEDNDVLPLLRTTVLAHSSGQVGKNVERLFAIIETIEKLHRSLNIAGRLDDRSVSGISGVEISYIGDDYNLNLYNGKSYNASAVFAKSKEDQTDDEKAFLISYNRRLQFVRALENSNLAQLSRETFEGNPIYSNYKRIVEANSVPIRVRMLPPEECIRPQYAVTAVAAKSDYRTSLARVMRDFLGRDSQYLTQEKTQLRARDTEPDTLGPAVRFGDGLGLVCGWGSSARYSLTRAKETSKSQRLMVRDSMLIEAPHPSLSQKLPIDEGKLTAFITVSQAAVNGELTEIFRSSPIVQERDTEIPCYELLNGSVQTGTLTLAPVNKELVENGKYAPVHLPFADNWGFLFRKKETVFNLDRVCVLSGVETFLDNSPLVFRVLEYTNGEDEGSFVEEELYRSPEIPRGEFLGGGVKPKRTGVKAIRKTDKYTDRPSRVAGTPVQKRDFSVRRVMPNLKSGGQGALEVEYKVITDGDLRGRLTIQAFTVIGSADATLELAEGESPMQRVAIPSKSKRKPTKPAGSVPKRAKRGSVPKTNDYGRKTNTTKAKLVFTPSDDAQSEDFAVYVTPAMRKTMETLLGRVASRSEFVSVVFTSENDSLSGLSVIEGDLTADGPPKRLRPTRGFAKKKKTYERRTEIVWFPEPEVVEKSAPVEEDLIAVVRTSALYQAVQTISKYSNLLFGTYDNTFAITGAYVGTIALYDKMFVVPSDTRRALPPNMSKDALVRSVAKQIGKSDKITSREIGNFSQVFRLLEAKLEKADEDRSALIQKKIANGGNPATIKITNADKKGTFLVKKQSSIGKTRALRLDLEKNSLAWVGDDSPSKDFQVMSGVSTSFKAPVVDINARHLLEMTTYKSAISKLFSGSALNDPIVITQIGDGVVILSTKLLSQFQGKNQASVFSVVEARRV